MRRTYSTVGHIHKIRFNHGSIAWNYAKNNVRQLRFFWINESSSHYLSSGKVKVLPSYIDPTTNFNESYKIDWASHINAIPVQNQTSPRLRWTNCFSPETVRSQAKHLSSIIRSTQISIKERIACMTRIPHIDELVNVTQQLRLSTSQPSQRRSI